MFTGIVERTGKVISITTTHARVSGDDHGTISQMIIEAGKDFDTKPGDSVSVNGCCLTVTSNKVHLLAFDISSESMAKTTLGYLSEGDEVNLERAMKLGDRLGGHMVSGHIDDRGEVVSIKKHPQGWDLSIMVPPHLSRYVIQKGSICLNGVSLTINSLEDSDTGTLVRLMLIPTTVSLTTFKSIRPHDEINVEVDLVGKYVERLGT